MASRGPRRRCQAAAERKIGMTSRVGRLSSLIYEGRKREGKEGPRLEGTRFEEGAGGSRGRRGCEEAIATRPTGAKIRSKHRQRPSRPGLWTGRGCRRGRGWLERRKSCRLRTKNRLGGHRRCRGRHARGHRPGVRVGKCTRGRGRVLEGATRGKRPGRMVGREQHWRPRGLGQRPCRGACGGAGTA